MSYTKVTEEDRQGKGVTGLPDVPQLTTGDMQAKLDELGNMGIDALNGLIDELEAVTGADSLGATVPEGITASPNVGSIIAAYGLLLSTLQSSAHIHLNYEALNSISSPVKAEYDRIASILQAINSFDNGVFDDAGSVPTGHAIVNYVSRLGGGDMLKARYDANDDGVVDNASAVQGHTVTDDPNAVISPTSTTGTQLITALALNNIYTNLVNSINGKIPTANIEQTLSAATNKVPSTALLNNINTNIGNSINSLSGVAIKIVDHFDVKATQTAHSVNLSSNKVYVFVISVHKVTTNGNPGVISGNVGVVLRYMDRYEDASGWVDKIVSQNIIAANANAILTNDIPNKVVKVSAKTGYMTNCTVLEIAL